MIAFGAIWVQFWLITVCGTHSEKKEKLGTEIRSWPVPARILLCVLDSTDLMGKEKRRIVRPRSEDIQDAIPVWDLETVQTELHKKKKKPYVQSFSLELRAYFQCFVCFRTSDWRILPTR